MARQHISKALKLILVGGPLFAPSLAECAPFPPQLLGKSVTVNWTTNMKNKLESGQIVYRARSVSLLIYISTAGRAFTREAFTVSGTAAGPGRRGIGGRHGGSSGTAESDQAPGDARSSKGGPRTVHFENGALIMDSQFFAGVEHISIGFDSGYGSCNARVILGREGGTGAIQMKSAVTGVRFEVLSAEQASAPSCAIASGNALGGQ